MPPINILVWNIQTFGSRGAVAEAIRCQALARIVRDANADVLVMQELLKTGVAFLPTLQAELDLVFGGPPSWHFDWIKGSLAGPGLSIPRTPADLDFTSAAHNEGYAVLYREGSLDPLVEPYLSAGQDGVGDHFIGMVTGGKAPKADFDTVIYPELQFYGNRTTSMVGFPTSSSKAIKRVDGVRSSKRKKKRKRLDPFEGVFETDARRPCFVFLRKQNARGGRAFTIVVNHAPAASPGNYYGTSVGFSVDELQVKNCAYAGDYNVIDDSERAKVRAWANSLGFTQSTFAGGGGDTPRTMVHAVTTNGWSRGADILTSARDFGFGNSAACTLQAYDAAVAFAAGSEIRNYFVANRASIVAIYPPLFFSFPGNYATDLLNNFAGPGVFPANTDEATARALLYYIVASDHLPILITVKF